MIAEQITRLMSHYWTADDDAVMRRAQVDDWLEDLMEFGSRVVADACGEWRRTATRRPTPADIRRLCREARPAWGFPEVMPPDSDLEARRMADEWAIARGFMSIEHFQRESFVGASIKLRGGGWMRFPGLRKPVTMAERPGLLPE